MTTVDNFQSAIQFVAGANLALFALPNLRQPALEEETRKWLALTEIVRPTEDGWHRLCTSRLKFLSLQRELDQKNTTVKALSLWFAGLYAVLLLWTSVAAEHPTDGTFLVAASILGAVPAVVLIGLNAKARTELAAIRSERQELERLIMSPGTL